MKPIERGGKGVLGKVSPAHPALHLQLLRALPTPPSSAGR